MKQNPILSTLKIKKPKPKAVYIVNIFKDLKKQVSETWFKWVQWFPICKKENTSTLISATTPRYSSFLAHVQTQQA